MHLVITGILDLILQKNKCQFILDFIALIAFHSLKFFPNAHAPGFAVVNEGAMNICLLQAQVS